MGESEVGFPLLQIHKQLASVSMENLTELLLTIQSALPCIYSACPVETIDKFTHTIIPVGVIQSVNVTQ